MIEPKSPKSNKAAIKQAVEFCLKNLRKKLITRARIYSTDPSSVQVALMHIIKKAQRRLSVRHRGYYKVLNKV
jgi:hypothetical protein